MPVYIEKSGDLVGSREGQQTNEQGKIGLLSQWTMGGWDEQKERKRYMSLKNGPP